MQLLQINILIFNFLCRLHVRNPGVYLQEDCYITNSYVIVLPTAQHRTHSSTYQTAYTDACKTHCTLPVRTAVFLKMNPRVRNM
jgi:hypothetical protein